MVRVIGHQVQFSCSVEFKLLNELFLATGQGYKGLQVQMEKNDEYFAYLQR